MTDTLTDAEVAKLQDILIEQLGVKREQLTPEARIQEDLGADSLELVQIAMAAEETFSILIPDNETEQIKTVQDLYEAIGSLLGRTR
jgi:acyl carrier protein